MSYEPDMPASSSAVAREKVNLPGILMLIVGILNILLSLYLILSGIVNMARPQQAVEDMPPEQKKQFDQLGWSPEKFARDLGASIIVVGVLGLIAGAITILAGIKMRALQSRGMVIFGSVLAMLPCISPCCLAGLPIGIWALVALNNPEVKAAFR